MDDRTDWREMVGTAACALLSLAAFVPLVFVVGQVPAIVAVGITLACPAVWLLFLHANRRRAAQELIPAPVVENVEPSVSQS